MGKNDIRKSSQNSLRRISVNSSKTLQRLEVSRSSVDPLPARGTTVFTVAWLNTWLQRTCSTKESTSSTTSIFSGATDNCFKLDGLHPKQTWCARVLKDNFLFLPPSSSFSVCANPLTHSPGQQYE